MCEGEGNCHVEVDGPHGEVNVCLCDTSGLPPKVPGTLEIYSEYGLYVVFIFAAVMGMFVAYLNFFYKEDSIAGQR